VDVSSWELMEVQARQERHQRTTEWLSRVRQHEACTHDERSHRVVDEHHRALEIRVRGSEPHDQSPARVDPRRLD